MDTTKQHEAPAETVDPRYPIAPIGIVRSRDAFLRDLPALLANPKYDRWLAVYCGNERIALAETHDEIIRQCKERDLKEDEYYMGCIGSHGEDDDEFESFYYEFEDIEEDEKDNSPLGPEGTP